MSRTTHYTSCPYNCWPVNCGLAVTTENGGVVEIAGNPHHDISRGRLCVKGQCSFEIASSPSRVTTPLIRDGERGSGRFKQASWDEVLTQIASRLKTNIDADRPEANALYHSHGNIVQRVNWKVLTPRFANLVGMTLWDGNFPCWYDVGVAQHMTGYWGLHDPVEIGAHSNALINWAQDPCASQANMVPYLLEIRDRGGKIVTIDPRVTQTAALSHIHLRPRLGTDTWLANAVAHILIRDGAYDDSFVTQHGLGFERYQKHIDAFPPKEAARICDLSTQEIDNLATVFAEIKPLSINLTRGALGKHKGGIQMVRAILCLIPLAGNLGVKGGGAVWGEAVDWNLDLCLEKRRPPASYPVNNFGAIDAALDQGMIDTLLIVGGNPLSQWPNLPRLRAQLKKIGLVIVNDLFLNHTAREVGDIILPATSWLEELGLRTSNSRVYIQEKITSPRDECREASAWMNDLARRLGINDYFPWADKEACLDDCLRSPACKHVTVAELRKCPEGIAADVPETPYSTFRFDSPSGKFEFYSNCAEALGLPPLPVFDEAYESPSATPELAASYPLQLISGRRNTHFHSFHDSHNAIATLRTLEPEPLLFVHPRDAATRGIADGDPVLMYNDRGSSHVKVEITTEVLPGHVSLNDSWPALNEVTPAFAPCPPEVTEATGMGGQPAYQNTLVEIRGEN
ncbi:MAG: molybdopterin-dependent oxidoreductase [Deltaproteobacteria bacterium]|nr:molybdopterin-dependent oxidoreductase [Deltaproteobacteria bacterium]